MTSPSDEIWNELSIGEPFLGYVWMQLIEQCKDHDAYVRYLILLYNIICASVPLTEEAHHQCEQDPMLSFNGALTNYYSEHICEEMDHDRWLLEDLKTLGVNSHSVNKWNPQVAKLVGSQYYWVRHVHPVILLGYVLVLEGHPPTLEQCERLQAAHGIPKAGLRTLRHHAVVDVKNHIVHLRHLIDTLPLSPEQFRQISMNATDTLFVLINMMNGLLTK